MDAPLFRISALFTGNRGGYPLYRIPGVVATTAGSLLVYCEARKELRGDWGSIDILSRRSSDGGLTWSPPVQLNPPGLVVPRSRAALAQAIGSAAERTFNNPVAIAGRQPGLVHFLFCAEYARCFYRRSLDDGQMWGETVDITAAFEALREQYPWQVIATGPGHGIQLERGPAAGRLLVPVWISDGTGGHAHRPSAVATIYSDDGGDTWHAGEMIVSHGPAAVNPSETAAVELADGRVMVNIRSESPFHRRLVAISPDGISRWSSPRPDPELFEPVCAAGLARSSPADPGKRSLLLFSNPDSRADGEPGPEVIAWKRENLILRASADGGRSWPAARVIDPGLAGYSDLAAAPDGTITCAYEGWTLAETGERTSHLSVAQFNLAWLLA